MSKKKSNKISEKSASAYTHEQEATQRPDVGVQPEFEARKPPTNYRYDSSLAPELSWDESAERDMAEWLLGLIGEAAEKGEAEVFSEPQAWKGSDERFDSIVACVARLKSLTQTVLNWTGKAERQQISVPTTTPLGLFVPYRRAGGVPARYIPDFIAELDIGLNLIIETKGQYGDDADIKAKAAQCWVTAVHLDGNCGLWAYEVVNDPTNLPLVIDRYSSAKWDENATLGAAGL